MSPDECRPVQVIVDGQEIRGPWAPLSPAEADVLEDEICAVWTRGRAAMTGQATREHALSEGDFQRRVMDCAKLHGWRRVHIRAARLGTRWVTPYEGDTGLPDLILARDGVVLLVELKAAKTPWKPGQREWLAAAGPCGFVWRPADWDTALAVLSTARVATARPETGETPR